MNTLFSMLQSATIEAILHLISISITRLIGATPDPVMESECEAARYSCSQGSVMQELLKAERRCR